MKEQKKINISKMREAIEEILNQIPEGARISLDTELIENLIFEVTTEKLKDNCSDEMEGKTITKKTVVWSGEFLSKIDLSKVSFEDVCWGDENEKDFQNTNIIVDFSKSFESKCYPKLKNSIVIKNSNFANTDLSNNTLTIDSEFKSCDFSNSGLKFDCNIFQTCRIYDVNFTGIDLSEYDVTEKDLTDTFCDENNPLSPFGIKEYLECNLTNTGLHLSIEPLTAEEVFYYNKAMEYKKKSVTNLTESEREEVRKLKTIVDRVENTLAVQDAIKNGLFNGCYLNGALIDFPGLVNSDESGVKRK